MKLMKKRVFIVHGWDGYPGEGWFPWLKKELEAKGYEVQVPQLPEAAVPRIKNWVPKLAEVVGVADESTYFVGHSMGCQTIARYLETLPGDVKIGGAVFVAGFFKELTLIQEEERDIAKEWLKVRVNLDKVKSHLLKSVAIFSDNDPWVPLSNQEEFKEKLGSEIIIEHKMGHFSWSDGIKELPLVLNKLLELR